MCNWRSILPFYLLAAVLVCCGVDEDTVRADITGTWTLEQITRSSCDNADDSGTESLTCSTASCIQLILTDSGTYFLETTMSGLVSSDNGPFTLMGSDLELCSEADEDGPSQCEAFAVTLDGNALVLTSSDKIEGCFQRNRYARN